MHIYSAEKQDGLSEVLSAKSSIVYASLAEKSDFTEPTKKEIMANKAFAGIEDTDLYYTQSILVTTSWNKNDDIFDAKEVWLARSTPTHKPTNLEHNESIIVGHITSNWPIDDDGNLLDENIDTDNLPEKFHILTGSVIYKGFTEPELRDRAELLIEEIENGEKYVSMECFFKGFDYGLINKTNGEYRILPRNEDTAFLTKHLRAYGGVGEHENYKIGRVLRYITFSGKGFVNRPANPESIIFTKDNLRLNSLASAKKIDKKNSDSVIEGVFSNQANLKETIMSVEPEVSQPETANEVVETAPVETTETVQTEATTVESEVVTVEVEKEEAAKKMQEEMMKKEEEMKKMKAALEIVQAELEATNEALAGYKAKEAEMLKKEKKMKRVALLMQNGIDEVLASTTVDKFESLNDEAFDSMASLLSAVKPVVATASEESTKAEETEVTTDDVSLALENVETEQGPDLAVGGETESEVQNTRAALVDFVCIRLGKNLNKGE